VPVDKPYVVEVEKKVEVKIPHPVPQPYEVVKKVPYTVEVRMRKNQLNFRVE
jgi:hypothetical protein